MVFDHDGAHIALAQEEHRQIYLRPGWVEHRPLEIWERTQQVVQAALAEARLQPGDLAAVGITNQRETTVVWNKQTGEPYCNAIVWQDTRTKEICDRLTAVGGPDRFRGTTGLPISTYFSGPKIEWILDNVDGVRAAAERGEAVFGTVDTWLIWWLTGGPGGGAHVTDVTNASRTMMMNLKTLDWDEEMLRILGIPRQMLPRIVPSSDPRTWGSTAKNGPFGPGIPVCGALGDQQAALVGQACFSPGEAKNTYGTGCFMLLNTGTSAVPSTSGLLTTLAYRFGDELPVYALEGSIAVTGALVQWMRDNLGIIHRSSDIEALARTVEDNGGIYFVPAFSGLFAPRWRSDARGVIAGLTRFVNKGHLARAVLEAAAYQTREVLEAMKKDSGVELAALKVDGGMVANDLLMRFQADILGVPVVRPAVAETTSLGAAYAAGLAAGVWDDLEGLRENWRADKTWKPEMDAATRDRLYKGWLKAVERTLNWIEE
jgi:glycerol kinase